MFETNRTQKGGGGLITAVHQEFNPSLIETEKENADILSVQCKIGNRNVRLINGMGRKNTIKLGIKWSFLLLLKLQLKVQN